MTNPQPAAKQPQVTQAAARRTPAPKPALVLFGIDSLNKPHASWFAAEEQEAACKAAAAMGFSTLLVTGEAQTQLASKLPRGRLFEGGRAFVPFVKHTLHEAIITLAAEQSKTGQAPSGPDAARADGERVPQGSPAPSDAQADKATAAQGAATAAGQTTSKAPPAAAAAAPASPLGAVDAPRHRRPKHWDEIATGDLVLAYDANSEAWYEAIVLAADGDLLRLRWRDYPLESLSPQRRDQLALMPPSA